MDVERLRDPFVGDLLFPSPGADHPLTLGYPGNDNRAFLVDFGEGIR